MCIRDSYIETLENLGKEDIHLVCYNFMPVFDWTRTELARKRPDGSTVLAYTCLLYTSCVDTSDSCSISPEAAAS